MLNGPNGPVGNFSLTTIAELQWGYIEQLIDPIRSSQAIGFEPGIEALEEYEFKRNAAAMKTVWATGCASWYLDATGVPQVWPWDSEEFSRIMNQPRWEDYLEIRVGDGSIVPAGRAFQSG
jgi:hypothetical protein